MDWISVKDRLPELNSIVLVSGRGMISIAKLYMYHTGEYLWRFFHSNWNWSKILPEERDEFLRNDTSLGVKNGCSFPLSLYANDITHWMPLPDLPTGDL